MSEENSINKPDVFSEQSCIKLKNIMKLKQFKFKFLNIFLCREMLNMDITQHVQPLTTFITRLHK